MRSNPPRTALPPGSPGSPGSSGSAGAPGGIRDSMHRSATASEPSGGAWWKLAGQPLVLRVPRGLALVLFVGGLFLLVVAYMIGLSQGHRQGVAAAGSDGGGILGFPALVVNPTPQATTPDSTERSPSRPTPAATARQTVTPTPIATAGNQTAVVNLVTLPGSADARQAGINYFIVNYPEAVARRLVAFALANGVEAQAIKRHNSASFQVIFLQGFGKSELSSPARREYERMLHRIGRTWKEQNPDATDLSQTYLVRYDGEVVDQVITRERRP